MASLGIWMNGMRVGEWGALRGGTHVFRYDPSWIDSPRARPLSLSLPLTADGEIRGAVVERYFDNLLPDSNEIRRRIRSRFGTDSTSAFDLLSAVGRDCVGAVQLLAPGDSPEDWQRVSAEPLSEREVERQLLAVTAPVVGRDPNSQEFRISLAGAQEKTALLCMGGRWFRPQHATPTTHILKLPLGLIGGVRADFSDSVENEWLCAQILQEMRLPVAQTTLGRFGEQRALIVTRFDRRWVGAEAAEVGKRRFQPGKGVWIARLPQEDFCQAFGLPPTQRYQADGGPSMQACLELLSQSEHAAQDRVNFILAQLAFWLLAATDGHAKNFSMHQRAGGAFSLTPLYDVLSLWPVTGRGRQQFAYQKLKLAMALRGSRSRYRLSEISANHWQELALQAGEPALAGRLHDFVQAAAGALERVEATLPSGFPARLFESVRDGVKRQARRFGQDSGKG